MKHSSIMTALLAIATGLILSACGSSNSRTPLITEPPPAPPPTAFTLSGNVYDGPVSGGSIYVFSADTISAALAAADQASDRNSALNDANPLATLSRAADSGPTYSIELDGEFADQALFLLFDASGSSDDFFGGASLNLLSMTEGVAAGGTGVVNITPHTSLISRIVQQLLDPDGDGTAIAQADIVSALADAQSNVLNALGTNASGEEFYADDTGPFSAEEEDVLTAASTFVATLMRSAAVVADVADSDVLTVLAADAADGELDGNIAAEFDLSEDQLEALADIETLLDAGLQTATADLPSCSNSARALHTACGYEVLDEVFVDSAKCVDSSNESGAMSCLAAVEEAQEEAIEECADVFEARSELCEVLNDEVYQPDYGPDFASNFIDPRNIGSTVTPNPYFPMVNGNEWVYSGTFEEDGETITEEIRITVSDKVKNVDGILCLVVRDVVTINQELVEDTDDWFAQDVDGNIWYCGEEVKDYETFEDDLPPLPELIAIDGSFKAGRDGDKAGIQLPFTPVPGDIFRQEVSLANAEDVIEILATDASAVVPAVTCTNTCLQTLDFSPLDPGVEEHKFYQPGVGKILEIDLETGDRFELVEFNQLP